jgi:hypothetical protein
MSVLSDLNLFGKARQKSDFYLPKSEGGTFDFRFWILDFGLKD